MGKANFSFVKLTGNFEEFSSKKLKDIQANHNRYWRLNETSYLLHEYTRSNPINQETFFYDEDFLSTIRFKGHMLSWAVEAFQKKELFTLSFSVGPNYRNEELQEQSEKLEIMILENKNDELSLLEIQEGLNLMEKLVQSDFGNIHFIDILKKQSHADILFRIYVNGVVEAITVWVHESCENEDIKEEYTLQFMHDLCKRLFVGDESINSGSWSEISFPELEKTDHPLRQAHELIEVLFEKGQKVCDELGVGIEERELILAFLLKQTKEFKDKPYLYEDEKQRFVQRLFNR